MNKYKIRNIALFLIGLIWLVSLTACSIPSLLYIDNNSELPTKPKHLVSNTTEPVTTKQMPASTINNVRSIPHDIAAIEIPNKLRIASKKSKSIYQVYVKKSVQKVFVYKKNNDEPFKTLVCSTGITSKPTPSGTFTISTRGDYFYSAKYKQGAFNWVKFKGAYLFHSVPTNINKIIIPEEQVKLGQQASHGCIRLSLEDSEWFYDSIPLGTVVLIEE